MKITWRQIRAVRGWSICFHLNEVMRSWVWAAECGRTLWCTFSRPSLNIRTHFLTMPSLIALSPYTWQIWWWISLGSTFLAFKKRITDRISQSADPSIVLNMFNAQEQTNITQISRNGVCGFSIDRGHCTCTKGQSREWARYMCRRYLLSK